METRKLSAFGVIKKALDIALTGPVLDSRRRSKDKSEWFSYIAERVEKELIRAKYLTDKEKEMGRKKQKEELEVYVVEGRFWYSDENDNRGFCLPILAEGFKDATEKAEEIARGFGPGLAEIHSEKKGSTL